MQGSAAFFAPLIATLPERQRLVVFLRYYADLDYRTIADALEIEVGSVSATLVARKRSVSLRGEGSAAAATGGGGSKRLMVRLTIAKSSALRARTDDCVGTFELRFGNDGPGAHSAGGSDRAAIAIPRPRFRIPGGT